MHKPDTPRGFLIGPFIGAVIVALFILPVTAMPLEIFIWAMSGVMSLSAPLEHGGEAVAFVLALMATGWLARRAYRSEARMAAGLEP